MRDTEPVQVFVVMPGPEPVPESVQERGESAPFTRKVYVAFFPEPGAELRFMTIEEMV